MKIFKIDETIKFKIAYYVAMRLFVRKEILKK